jgi:predicted PurR-regulated permease PerM
VSGPDPRQATNGDAPTRPSLTPMSLLIVLLIFYLMVQVQIIVFLLLFAVLFATVIERPVIRLENRGFPRPAGIFMMYGAILLGLVGLGLVFVPLITNEARNFTTEAPILLDEVAASWRTSDNQLLSRTGYRLVSQLKFRIENPPPPTGGTAIGLLTGVGTVVFGIVATFVIAFYYLMEKHRFKRLLLQNLQPETRERVNAVWNDVEMKVGQWLRGQLTLCVIIGVFAGIGYGLIGLRFWVLLAVFAAVTEIVPIIGPWIGGIPAFIVALLDSWQKAILIAVFLIILQFLENSVLVPRVMKGAVGLSPLTVFLAVLAGAEFMGPLGALLAIPFAAAIQIIIADALRIRQQQRTELAFAVGPATSTQGGVQQWRTVLTQFLADPDKEPPSSSAPGESSQRTDPRSGHESAGRLGND